MSSLTSGGAFHKIFARFGQYIECSIYGIMGDNSYRYFIYKHSNRTYHGTPVVGRRDGPEPFLPGCVPTNIHTLKVSIPAIVVSNSGFSSCENQGDVLNHLSKY